MAIRAIAIPLICGNTVVLKSSEQCPRTNATIVELFEEVSTRNDRFCEPTKRAYTVQAGLPKGVLNFVSTSKDDAPARVAQIIAHPAVRKVNVSPVPVMLIY